MSYTETTLANAASDRKARLIALRRRKEGEANAENAHFEFKQRNFDPETRQPTKRIRSAPSNGQDPNQAEDSEDEEGEEGEQRLITGLGSKGETVEDRVAGLTEKIVKQDEKKRAEELDLLNIAPKRANWDLKRDMDKRLRVLERKTNESYNTLFRQRLQSLRSTTQPTQPTISSSTATSGSTATGLGGKDLLANMQAAEEQVRRQIEDEEREMGVDGMEVE